LFGASRFGTPDAHLPHDWLCFSSVPSFSAQKRGKLASFGAFALCFLSSPRVRYPAPESPIRNRRSAVPAASPAWIGFVWRIWHRAKRGGPSQAPRPPGHRAAVAVVQCNLHLYDHDLLLVNSSLDVCAFVVRLSYMPRPQPSSEKFPTLPLTATLF